MVVVTTPRMHLGVVKGGLTQLDALVVRVQQEGPEAVGDVVVGQELQVVLAELKLHGELQVDLRGGDHDQPTHYHHPHQQERKVMKLTWDREFVWRNTSLTT